MSKELDRFFIFEVQASEPQGTSGNYPSYSNLTTFVIAPSLERALQLARVQHPEMRTHQVIRRNQSSKALIVDPLLHKMMMEDDSG